MSLTSDLSARGARDLLLVASLGLLLSLCACDSGLEIEGPSDVSIRSDTVVAARPGAIVGPLVVQVLGAPIQGVPGRNGRRNPVEKVEVTFDFKGWEERARSRFPQPQPLPQPLPQPQLPSPPTFLAVPATDYPSASVFDPSASTLTENDDGSVTVRTDENGYAAVQARLGLFVGDFRVRAEIRNRKQQRRSVDFLVISGIEVLQTQREGPPGSQLDVNVQVWKVIDVDPPTSPGGQQHSGDGKSGEDAPPHDAAADRGDSTAPGVVPDSGRRVFFTVIDEAGRRQDSRLEDEADRTNKSGIATLKLRLGEHTGVHRVLAEIEPEEKSPIHRGVIIECGTIDIWEIGRSVLGGVVLFVVGLKLLASALLIRLSPFLHRLASSSRRRRLVATTHGVMAGLVFQSSSTVVSHLVSFANGGLLVAAAASGQVLGANVGKTFLLQVIALESVGSLALPLVAVGTVIMFLPARLGSRAWAGTFLGAGLTLLGWKLLGDTAGLMAISPGLRESIHAWDPWARSHGFFSAVLIFGIDTIIALLLAALVRGANLPVAGAMVLVAHGLVSFAVVIPVIVGAGIGSALATFLTTLDRKREARLLALSQVVNQTLGGAWLLVLTIIPAGGVPLLTHIADWITPGLLFHTTPENVSHHVAMLFTAFHLVNGLLFLLLGPWVEKLTARMIPRDPVRDDVKPFRLDPSLVDVPSLALTQATREVCYLGELVRKAVAESFDSFRYLDLNLTDQIARREESIDTIHSMVTQYLLRIGENNLSRANAARLESLQSASGNFSRIGELSDHLCHLTARSLEEKLEAPEDLLRELSDLYDLVIGQFDNVLHLLEAHDPRVEENAMKVGERIAKSTSRIENLWFQKIRQQGTENDRPDESTYVTVFLTRQAYDTLAQVASHLTHTVARIRILWTR